MVLEVEVAVAGAVVGEECPTASPATSAAAVTKEGPTMAVVVAACTTIVAATEEDTTIVSGLATIGI